MPGLRSVLTAIAFGSMLLALGWLYVRQNVDSHATRVIQQKLNAHFADSNYRATLRAARFVEGKGIELHDLKIVDSRNPESSLLQIYFALVNTPATLSNLITQDVNPTSIEIKRAVLQVTRDQQGAVNVADLWNCMRRSKSCFKLVPIELRDCSVRFCDRFDRSGRVRDDRDGQRKIDFQDVNIEVNPILFQGRELIDIRVSSRGDRIHDLAAQSYIDRSNQTWMVDLKHFQSQIADDILEFLPQEVVAKLELLRGFSAEVIARGRFDGKFDSDQIPKFHVDAQIVNLTVLNHSLPVAVDRCNARVHIDNNGLEVINAAGRLGESAFQLSLQQQGLIAGERWNVEGWIKNFQIKREMLSLFPQFCKTFYRDYSPLGTSDIQFKISSDGTRDVRAQLTDMSFEFYRFPYRVNNCVGTVRWSGNQIEFQVQGLESEQVIEFQGKINNPGPNVTYVVNIRTLGDLPIDQKLFSAIAVSPKMSTAVREFRPTGRIRCVGKIEKSNPHSPLANKEFDISLHQCTSRHKKFDYAMHDINGMVHVRNERFTFDQVTGTNSCGQVVCNGVWNEEDGLHLRFLCNSVALDDRLRNALTPNIRDVWDSFQPSGTVSVGRVSLDLPPGEEFVDVRVSADLAGNSGGMNQSNVSINPFWFPYRLNQLTGQVEIGGGTVVLKNIRGKHGRTWISCRGAGNYSLVDWAVKLQDLLVGSLVADDDLLKALPQSLQESVRQLNFKGQLNIQGEITLAGKHTNQPIVAEAGGQNVQLASYDSPMTNTTTMGWNLRLDMEQAKLQLGWPLNSVFGSVELVGQYDGINTQCHGNVNVESLTFQDIQITNLQGPIWIDNYRACAGKFAEPGKAPDDARPLVGQALGGTLQIDGWVTAENKQPFFLQASLSNTNLSEVAKEVAPQFPDISGTGFAAIRLAGNSYESHSVNGEGDIQLRDAKIYQLPVMLSLLKILNVKEVSRTAFDTGNLNFSILGDQISLNRVELIGDAISLIGQGTLDTKRQIDLNFYTVMGRNRVNIPILSELYRAGSQRILWINIDGSLDRPQTHRHVLPGLNDRLQNLFQPIEQNPTSRANSMFNSAGDPAFGQR